MSEMSDKTDHELLLICGHQAITMPAKREIRRRYPSETSPPKKIDLGHFFVANFGALEGIWACKKDGKTTRARLHGERWEQFKRDHPDWEKDGKE